DLRRHTVLLAPEVDDAVLLLVTTTAVARRHATVRVAPAGARLGFGERLLRLVARDLREVGDGLEPATGAGGLALADRHRQPPKISIESPSARETMARLEPGRVPKPPVRRLRFRFPLRFTVFTLVTRTSKMVSIA